VNPVGYVYLTNSLVQVNGTRVGKGRAALLRDGNELAFGSKDPPGAGEDEANDFRMSSQLTTFILC
jgi:hypothetical protein